MAYDEKAFWSAREFPNAKNTSGTLRRIIEYVTRNVAGCRNIVDYGAGVGRILPALTEADSVTAFDIHGRHLPKLKQVAKKYSFEFEFKTGFVGDSGFADNAFDAAVCVQVLLHQRPENINNVILDLVRISRKAVVVSYSEPNKNIKIAEHNFNYNYLAIAKALGLEVSNVERNGSLIYFVLREGKDAVI